MKWLLLKDLRIMQRSPLLTALLVAYPIVIAVLIGFALSAGPDKPRVAFLNQVPTDTPFEIGGESFDLIGARSELCERLWEFVLDLAGAGTTVIYSTHHLYEAERYGNRLLVLADGQRLFDGTPAELHSAAPSRPGDDDAADFESAFVRYLVERGH